MQKISYGEWEYHPMYGLYSREVYVNGNYKGREYSTREDVYNMSINK